MNAHDALLLLIGVSVGIWGTLSWMLLGQQARKLRELRKR